MVHKQIYCFQSRTTMLTIKEKILIRPFLDRKFVNHRRKVKRKTKFVAKMKSNCTFAIYHQVQSAQPAIDFHRPMQQPHVLIKLKKIQQERERMQEIERENQRLLQKLTQIMNTNRLENFWREPRPK